MNDMTVPVADRQAVPTKQAELTGLDLLRKPFPQNQIGKLPKATKQQTDAVKADFKKGVRCTLCGQWHHKDVVHLDYVGHAALTDRLLDCDPMWNWEPVSFGPDGLPARDQSGGMWIKLTVCGVTRLGYGDATGKSGGDAVKEVIGDALRNAAMRFGAALDLWHKGDLHGDQDADQPVTEDSPSQDHEADFERAVLDAINAIPREKTTDSLGEFWKNLCATARPVAADSRVIKAKDDRKAALTRPSADIGDDQIPY